MFDGTSWAAMGSDGAGNGPLNGPVNALAAFGGQVVAGGNFTTAGGDGNASYVARYPGLGAPPPAPPPVGQLVTATATLFPAVAPPTLPAVRRPPPRFTFGRLVVKPGPRHPAKISLDCPAPTGQKCTIKGTLTSGGKVVATVAGSVPGQHVGPVTVTFTTAGHKVISKTPTATKLTATSTTAGARTPLTPQSVAVSTVLGLAPSVKTGASSDLVVSTLTTARATVAGFVNPHGRATRYHFEYGNSSGYGMVAPATAGNAGDDEVQHLVTARLTGLQYGTTYHYRLVADSLGGTSAGADRRFFLPSPPVDTSQHAGVSVPAQAQLNNTYHCSTLTGWLIHGQQLECDLTLRYDAPLNTGSMFGPDPVYGSVIALAPVGLVMTSSGELYQRVDFVLPAAAQAELNVNLSFTVQHPHFGTESIVLQGYGPTTMADTPPVAKPKILTTSSCSGRRRTPGSVITCAITTTNAGLDAANFSTFVLHPSSGLTALGAVSGTPPDVAPASFIAPTTYTERFRIAKTATADTALGIHLTSTGVDETDEDTFTHNQDFALGHVTAAATRG